MAALRADSSPEPAADASSLPCPVCRASKSRPFVTVAGRDYRRCTGCLATWLHPDQRLPPVEELAEYERHRNAIDDPGYRRFLWRIAAPLLARLPAGARGLDYGCGPGPALAAMLAESGHPMAVFDPIYAPDHELLKPGYDFITCTEVAEHFHQPAAEFERLHSLLRPGGWLALMTRFQTDDDRFAGWHYRRDPTHVVFYKAETLSWLADHHGWDAELLPPDRMLARKRG